MKINGSVMGGLAALLLSLGVARGVSANEGVANLRGTAGQGACFVASVYVDGSYRILASCRDLRIALTPEKNKYVLWMTPASEEETKPRRLGEIVNGKLASSSDIKFGNVFVTVEQDAFTSKPSEDLVMSGDMMSIDFGAGVKGGDRLVTATPTPTPTKSTKVTTTTTTDQNGDIVVTEARKTSLGSVLGSVFKIVLLGFGVLLIIVGVFSFLSRRRSL